MTDDNKPERYLLDRPQRLGILPTWWFWNDRKHWKLVRWPFAITVGVAVFVFGVLSLPHAVEFAVLVGGYVLALGSVEKYVRHKAMKRRALAEPNERKAVGS